MQRGVVERRDDQRDADAGWPSRKKSVNVQLPPRAYPDGDAEETPDAFAPVADGDDGSIYSDARKITSNDVEQYLQAGKADALRPIRRHDAVKKIFFFVHVFSYSVAPLSAGQFSRGREKDRWTRTDDERLLRATLLSRPLRRPRGAAGVPSGRRSRSSSGRRRHWVWRSTLPGSSRGSAAGSGGDVYDGGGRRLATLPG